MRKKKRTARQQLRESPVWYWAAGILLAGLSEVWFRQVKKISEEKAQPLGFFRFGPMMICLIVRYFGWLLHHK